MEEDQQQEDEQYNENENENNNDDNNNIEMQVDSCKWAWAQPLIEGVPPCQRGGHSGTLSGASIIFFGGHYYAGKQKGYVYLNDTYCLDVHSNRWQKQKISGTPPEARYLHSAILAGSRIIVFGGKGAKEQVFRDLHALDPVSMTWFQGPEGSGSPSARYGHTATLYNNTKMIIFGGSNSKHYFNDLYILDLEVMAWSKPQCQGPIPQPRAQHVAIQVGNNLIIQGGFKFDEEEQMESGFRQGSQLRTCYLNDLRIFDINTYTWSRLRVSGTPPLPRYGHSANISGSDILFFGGWTYNSGQKQRNDNIAKSDSDLQSKEYFTVLNTDTMCWHQATFKEGVVPLSRYGHTATSIGPHVLIFGGWEHNRSTNETIVLRDLTITKQL